MCNILQQAFSSRENNDRIYLFQSVCQMEWCEGGEGRPNQNQGAHLGNCNGDSEKPGEGETGI